MPPTDIQKGKRYLGGNGVVRLVTAISFSRDKVSVHYTTTYHHQQFRIGRKGKCSLKKFSVWADRETRITPIADWVMKAHRGGANTQTVLRSVLVPGESSACPLVTIERTTELGWRVTLRRSASESETLSISPLGETTTRATISIGPVKRELMNR